MDAIKNPDYLCGTAQAVSQFREALQNFLVLQYINRTMARGILPAVRQFAPRVQMTIRNAAAHSTDLKSEQDALEWLAALSLLARWVESCALFEYCDPAVPPG